MNIYQKLNKIQTELKAPKNQKNNFGNYFYRSCEDILEALKPLLEKYQCILVMDDELLSKDGRFYVQSTATLVNCDGELIEVEEIHATALAREEESKKGMDSAQLTGATSSYARKYALNGLFAIDDNKDSDSTNKHGKEDKAEEEIKAEKSVKEKAREYLLFLANNDVNKAKELLKQYSSFKGKDDKVVEGVDHIDKLSDKRLSATYGLIKKDYLAKGGKV